jgi:pimeloyl-ACP methyl ester carboxylesterase
MSERKVDRGKTRSEDVRFESDGVTLAGTFVDPDSARTSALILTGSGQLDRNSNGPKLNLNINSAIADALAARGISSLRYDKRGAGESGGDFFEASLSDNYADAVAALGWLATRTHGVPLVAVGHSEGSLHVAHLAADGKLVGAVLIAPPALRGEETLTWQAAQVVPTLPRATRSILKLLHIDPLASQRKAFERIRSTSAGTIRVQGKKLNARWFREFMDYDPAPVYKQVDVPVLVLIGEHDFQVPPAGAEAIGRLVPGACEVQLIPNLSHILRDDPDSRGPRDYPREVRQPVSPVVLERIGDWIEAQLGPHTAKAPGRHDRE